MKTINQAFVIKASPQRVYEALTKVSDIKKWTRAKATFEAKAGGTYTMWDGWVKGTISELVPGKKLVQTWEPSDWDPQIEKSVATFSLTEKGGGTEVMFNQTNVPEKQFKSTDDGWRDYYLGALQQYLEKK